ncbi:MAG: heme exporter protein CcmB [Anaerolineales bacterium]|jgi:heme exporter protein B
MVETAPAQARPAGPGNYFRSVGVIVWKDLAAELRSKELLGAMLVFALLVLLVFNFALELDLPLRQAVAPGVLWVTFAFAGTLGLNRSLALERERGCWEGLLLAPVDRSAIYLGKAFGSFLFMAIMEALVLPIYSALYNINLFQPGLLLVVLLGSIGYVSLGTLLAAMAIQARTRDVLLPILLFPVVLPVLISAVNASAGFLSAAPMDQIWPWLNLLIACDVIFVAVSYLLFEYVVEE